MSTVAQFIRNRNGTTANKASIAPFLYFGNPSGGVIDPDSEEDTNFDSSYDPINEKTLKHLKISVAPVEGSIPIIQLDTLDCYNGINIHESPPNNFQGNLSGEAGDFPVISEGNGGDGAQTGPAKGMPLSLRRIHFFGFQKDGCCDTASEYYAYTLISNPVKIDAAGCTPTEQSSEGAGDGGPTTDKEEQERGVVESWNDLTYISEDGAPTAAQYNARLVIGKVDNVTSPDAIDYSLLQSPPECENLEYLGQIESVVYTMESGENGETTDCPTSKAMKMGDIASAAFHFIFNKLGEAYSQTPGQHEVQLLSDISLDSGENTITWNAYKLTCSGEEGAIPEIIVTKVTGSLATTTCVEDII